LNRGGKQTLLELHPKTKTEEMSHFVRHDRIMCHSEERSDEESPLLKEEGIALLQLHPKLIFAFLG